MEKECTGCKAVKPFSEYHRRKKGRIGIMSKCKDCCRKKTANWRANNRRRHSEIQREYVRRQKATNPSGWKTTTATYSKRFRTNNKAKVLEWARVYKNKCTSDLRAPYLRRLIRDQTKRSIGLDDVPLILIELKRNALQLKREIKNLTTHGS